ncbi:ribonuclease H-like domain-containing protein [Tanacetum coccineum]|uniref:Ribonuclease H-like domain-containing protein n=1 Tax=Tanacetum coccineum TaxID=301880 RepID=A0ABQ5CP03_9ASTR
MTTMTENMIVVGADNYPPMLEKSMYNSWQSRMLLYIRGPVTTEEKVQKKNDVKARSMLLMALPNEHLMTFNQYKDAKTLFAAIQTRFGGNEATKKTQKTLLKQMYENFSAPRTESLDSIFNRLQKIVSQLAISGENISQEDLNLKFLRSLTFEWNTHVVVWRNKPDLDTMSFDDLYNNFKIVEQEVKGTASSSSSSQNMAFVSSPSSTNKVNTAYGVSTANTQVSPASTQVSTVSTQVSTANLRDDTVYALLASQPNGSQLVYEDLEQIHEDDMEEMDLKCDTTGYDKSKVECFNSHKMGYFARACRGPRNQYSRNRNQDSYRRTVNVEETSSKAMVAIDGAGFDWSYMVDEEISMLKSELEKLKQEKESNQLKIENFDNASKSLDKLIGSQIPDKSRKGVGFVSYNVVPPPPTGLFSPQNLDLSYSGLEEFQQAKFEGNGPKSSKSITEDISNEVREYLDALLVEELVSDDKLEKKTIFLLLLRWNLLDLNNKKNQLGNQPKAVNTARPTSTVVNAMRANQVNAVKALACWVWRPTKLNSASITLKRHNYGHPQKEDQGYVDSRCSRHMTRNMSYLPDFKEFDGGYITFGGGAKGGKITGKGTLKTASKDETSDIFKSFITKIENLVDKKVKIIICDNETEFKNRVMSEFCKEKGIKKEFSVARTPQQNGVAERRNRTLIEVARTMLADSKLPTTFWAEAVNTDCYVQNRVLVVKPHNKTPYELLRGRKPALSFMRPFGCHVTVTPRQGGNTRRNIMDIIIIKWCQQ